ncbi:hypothetical protein CANMA_002933 [Candida margitis]|uniref:uncharacterized protein n=1 Tax=Candida margitis TaxID=1775924 RepID=UPI00222725FE|nr:uncharacterized protein CANMA_002933 [Candida margitis]KAI5967753.1 hypothetical protein CANMA_002933 [Candida margitis]
MMLRYKNIPKLRSLRPRWNSNLLCNIAFIRNISTEPKIFDENVIIPEEEKNRSLERFIREYYRGQGQFKNSFVTHCVNLSSQMVAVNLPMTPPTDFHDIVMANRYNVPQIGSFVEFSQNDQTRVGIVVQNLLARFDERLNHVLVLTNDNEILPVKSLNIKFHLYKLIPDGFLAYHEIINERHNPSHLERRKAVVLINRFLADTAQSRCEISSSIDTVFNQLSQDKLRPISLLDVLDLLEFKESDVVKMISLLYHQFVLLYSIHGSLVDSCQWVVPSYVGGTPSNVMLWGHSNNYHSASQYFVNTQDGWLHIYRFTQEMSSDDRVAEINAFLRKLKSIPKEEMNAYLKVFEGRHFFDVLSAMKFAVVYPHSSITNELGKLKVFETTPSALDIYSLLVELKIYDNTATITDIYLSSGLFGTSKELSVTEVGQLSPKSPASFNVKDNFKHLRTCRNYYHDHVIYGLIDDDDDVASFGISIESLNSRKHLINIHIPDLASYITPNSKVFKSIFQNQKLAETLTHLVNNQNWNPLFPEKVTRGKKFHKYSKVDENEEAWGDVIDMDLGRSTRKRGISKATCLTISFEFNSYETNPFESFDDKVSVSFDSIANVNMKTVNKRVLQKCLTGQLEPSFFKFLRRKQRLETDNDIHDQENSLNKTDIHNINFIGGVLKTFQKVRELEGAAITAPLKGLSAFETTVLKTQENGTGNGTEIQICKPDVSVAMTQAEFMHQEVRTFTGCLVSMFCFQNQIPILTRSQDLDVNELKQDTVAVQHENIMIPIYESQKYAHSVMAKDERGYISLNAKIISNNYVAPKFTATGPERNTPLGLSMGYAEVLDIFSSGEALLNQFQLLSYIQNDYQRTILKKHSYIEFVEKFNHLKSLGYNLNGPLSEHKLIQLVNSANMNDLRSVWQYRMYKFWIHNWFYQRQLDKTTLDETKLECISTHIDRLDDYDICKAYCLELGVEVDVLCLPNQGIQIGARLMCDDVLYLDPISGFCMLDGRGDICI